MPSVGTLLGRVIPGNRCEEWGDAVNGCICHLLLYTNTLLHPKTLKDKAFIISQFLWVRNPGAAQRSACHSGSLIRTSPQGSQQGQLLFPEPGHRGEREQKRASKSKSFYNLIPEGTFYHCCHIVFTKVTRFNSHSRREDYPQT